MEDRTKNKGCASSPAGNDDTLKKIITPALYREGFEWASIGGYKNGHGGTKNFDKNFALYIRKRPVKDVTNHDKTRVENEPPRGRGFKGTPEKPLEIKGFSTGSGSLMGRQERRLTPSPDSSSSGVSEPGTTGRGQKRKSSANAETAGVVASGTGDNLPALSDFGSYPSLAAVRTDEPALCIGYDSEWQNIHFSDGVNAREMLSWQFACVWDGLLWEFLFLARSAELLDLSVALASIYDRLNLYQPVDARKVRRYMYCTDFKDGKPVVKVTADLMEARKNAVYIYVPDLKDPEGKFLALPSMRFVGKRISEMPDRNAKRKDRSWAWFHTFNDFSGCGHIPTVLVCHAGKVDVSGLDTNYRLLKCDDGSTVEVFDYVLKHGTEVQGGLISLQPMLYSARSLNRSADNRYIYPVFLSLRDTMCQAPVGKKRLADLGDIVGVPKVFLPADVKDDMKSVITCNPALYANYASQDAVVTVLYAAGLYGYNRNFPVTATSAGARVMKTTIYEYLGCESEDDFDMIYRGIQTVDMNTLKLHDRPGYLVATQKMPVNDKANSVQYYASQAYHGGYNSCSDVGYYPEWTYDYDLQNAYPTAMCMVGDIDWQNPIKSTITNRLLTLQDWWVAGSIFNPLMPMVAYVRFEFPEDVQFPCIPVNVRGIPLFPRTSAGANNGNGDFVYACGPELYLAVKLGAKVFCETGYVLNPLMRTDGLNITESKSLSVAVKQLVLDRKAAKRDHGKGSLEELFLKLLVNAGYGKVAQNVIQKEKWSAMTDDMQALGESVITNPVSACMITSIVRAELLAAENQIAQAGYMACSVTTDGFISSAPEDFLKGLDLFGLRPWMEQARLFLTDGASPELWEAKHKQDDLVNFTTRGNVSLRCKARDGFDGVCAHNSTKSPFPSDSYEDRKWLMTQVLSRTGSVDWTCDEWTVYKDIVHGEDFTTSPTVHHIRMDFDCKRKPVRESIHDTHPAIDGVEYTIANFTTRPYETVAEYRLYREKRDLCTLAKNKGKQTVVSCLRTASDWNTFFLKLDTNACGAIVTDLEWSKVTSVVMGFRAGRWNIPGLNSGTVQQKCDFINRHNKSGKPYTATDWKNARRPERQKNMLPDEITVDLLKEMQSDKINADGTESEVI